MDHKPQVLSRLSIMTLLCLALFATAAWAQDSIGEPGRGSDKKNPLKNVYFGEQHMHTRNSFDAFTVGVNQTWDQAFDYAKGKEVTLSTSGEKIRKRTPYDFVAITDHAEYFGVLKEFANPDSPLSKSDFAKAIVAGQTNPAAGGASLAKLIASLFASQPIPEYATPELRTSMWQTYVEAADRHYEPGRFTTLYAFEWTSIPFGSEPPSERLLPRRRSRPDVTFSTVDSLQCRQDLWTYLEDPAGRRAIDVLRDSAQFGNVSQHAWMYNPNTSSYGGAHRQ